MIVMSIAGVDPSAGAGVYADLKTFQALGVYGTGIVTALTAQNPNKVYSIKPIEADFIGEQIDAVLDSYDITYIKTGMLYSKEVVDVVIGKIREHDLKCVVDPVMVATSGGALYRNELVEAFKKLLKVAIFTTPNVDEAIKLTDVEINDVNTAKDASLKLGKFCNNMITGGHLQGNNVINIDSKITVSRQELIETGNLHGSGCNFSAAIVSYLAKGETLENAIGLAEKYTHSAIENGNYGTLIPKI
ncbi:MAG: bifunctional hydroxymethylpyrimidine kinase/phosphomethylpyrimidine kinase [Methanobrevibacter sp.]|uniref:bifunctional hydroxymethylpyrimidine kinase/phosphomethylpyrimidine kinase n=1 Tax=Methanobrevibacter sp. TaxID=66852 RepID=UPI0026E0F841|nr:bifunctional hydroxymethylpyrimidine kinase/phosphomethylpyrimidine kinase [Methanobrevibacter sp.]MDO5849049.1 bifunctional hydroxymethylpyrimidine kinase/phosphomethylpyrimidine kinase [Methanobrevibacter sp.]